MNLLHQYRYTINSTGGTATALEDAGVSVTRVEEITHFPETVICFILNICLAQNFLLLHFFNDLKNICDSTAMVYYEYGLY